MKTIVVAVLGGILTLGGIALLVLPGPGFVLIAAGLALLATRFSWAQKPLDYAKGKAAEGIEEVSKSWWRAAVAALFGIAVLAVGVLEVAGVDVPFITVASAVLLIVSGIALLGILVYARVSARGPQANTPLGRG